MKILLCSLMAVAGALSASADDWSVWRGPNRTGISAESAWGVGASQTLWTNDFGVGYSSVSVNDGKLYTMGNFDETDTVYCLDSLTGEEIWTHSYACEDGKFKGPRSTPVLDNGFVYTVSRKGLVICFDALSGAVQWELDALKKTGNEDNRWGIATSAVIEGDILLLNMGGSGIALQKQSGNILWQSQGTASYATPVVFDHKGQRVAAIFAGLGLYIVDVATGDEVAFYSWETKYSINGADPLILGDRIFISSGYERGGALLDFSGDTLELIWENTILNTQFSGTIVRDGYFYAVDGNEKTKAYLRCVRIEDGVEMWGERTGFGSLIMADNRLIFFGDRGAVLELNATPDSYQEVARIETDLPRVCWTPPVLANGILYCRSSKGPFTALDLRLKK